VRRLMLLVLTAALIMGACGGSSDQPSGDPEGTLIAALLRLQNQPSSVTLTLRSDPQSLRALAAQDGGDIPSDAELSKLLDSTLTVSHNSETDPAKALSETTVTIGGVRTIETRMIHRTLYVRADVKELARSFGTGDADLQGLTREAESYGLGFIKAALAGKWLSFAGLDKFVAQQSGASMPGGSKQKEASDAFAQKLLSAARVTTVGEDAAGTHLAVSLPARQAYAALRDAIAKLGSIPAGAPAPAAVTVPNKTIQLDAWVKEGKLTQIELDLRQLAALGDKPIPSSVDQLAVRMTFRDFTGTIEAPSGAVRVHLNELAKMFAAGGMESSASGASSSHPATLMPDAPLTNMDCSALTGMPREEIRSLLAGSPARLTALARLCPALHLRA
jgi:hypothetical protein